MTGWSSISVLPPVYEMLSRLSYKREVLNETVLHLSLLSGTGGKGPP